MQHPARAARRNAAPRHLAVSAATWVGAARSAIAAAVLAGACGVTACASPGLSGSFSAASPAAASNADLTTLYVARRHWHIDVGFAADDLRLPLLEVRQRFPGARYLFFGFGDRRYLLSQWHDAPTLLGALWPGAGLILATALDGSPQQAFGAAEVIELRLTAEQARGAQAFIADSLSKKTDGTLAPSLPGPYADSLYFEALPRYSGLHTCITWAAEALRAAGLPVRSRLTLLAGQLWRQVRGLEGRAEEPGAAAAASPAR